MIRSVWARNVTGTRILRLFHIKYQVTVREREREREQIEQVITKKLTLILDKVDDINKFD